MEIPGPNDRISLHPREFNIESLPIRKMGARLGLI